MGSKKHLMDKMISTERLILSAMMAEVWWDKHLGSLSRILDIGTKSKKKLTGTKG
jgi:hypothetical protein